MEVLPLFILLYNQDEDYMLFYSALFIALYSVYLENKSKASVLLGILSDACNLNKHTLLESRIMIHVT